MSLSKSSLMFAVVALVTCTAMAEQDTCAIADPPSEAGEQAHMGELLLVYPRAKNIGEAFTGCQSLWGRAKAGTQLIGRFEYMKGSRSWPYTTVKTVSGASTGMANSSPFLRQHVPRARPLPFPRCLRAASLRFNVQSKPTIRPLPSAASLSSVGPNPSVKGTSCGKPQAAPYVER